MVVSTNEINLYRMLTRCEQLVNSESEWSDIDKGKFVAYVRRLQNLQHEPDVTNKYGTRIQRLADAVGSRGMTVAVNKGILEARMTKQSLLDGLKRAQQPDEPEWLEKIKSTPDEEITSQEKDDKSDNESTSISASKPEEESNQMRRRQGSGMTREEETSNIEHVLQHHRQMHDELTTDLSRMAKQLKANSQSFGDTLANDDKVLQDAQQAVVDNLERLRKERQRLDAHYSKSWGTSFMTMGVVLFVCIMFILVFFTIKLLPKP
ncbi:vesicle transport protein [Fennellomyces sp. T-0311]|nr:vesicle transport protein [Fennellomyces sp. T-0311]